MPSHPPSPAPDGNSSAAVDGKSEELMWQSTGDPAKTRGRHLAGNDSAGVDGREGGPLIFDVVSDVAGQLSGGASVGGGSEFQQGGLGGGGNVERGDEAPQ